MIKTPRSPGVSRLAFAAAAICFCSLATGQELPPGGDLFEQRAEAGGFLARGLAFSYGTGFEAPVRPLLSLAAAGIPQDEPPSRGTLFSWNSEDENTGGPQLDEPLVTDRPDFTESSVAVGRGVVQVEFGYTFTSSTSEGVTVRTQTVGEQLLRAGFYADWLEFRLGMIPGLLMDSIDDFDFSFPIAFEQTKSAGVSHSTAGLTDLYTGLKIALVPQEGLLPEMAVIPQMNIPTGSASFSSDKFQPGVNLVYGWTLDDTFATGGSTQVNRSFDDSGDDYPEWAQSWTVACGLSDGLGAFAEWFAFFPRGTDTAGAQQYLNGGLAWAITDDFQFDIRVGFGLNDEADDFFIGSGFSFRKP